MVELIPMRTTAGRNSLGIGCAALQAGSRSFFFFNYDRVGPNGKHINGMTPLLVAGSSGELQSVHVINMLLEDSRVDGHARDDDGCNVCMLAAKHVQGKIIAGLLPTLHDAGDGDQRPTPEKMYTPRWKTRWLISNGFQRSSRGITPHRCSLTPSA